MGYFFTIIASSSSGLGALGVSSSAFVIQLVTFILGYLVLKKWAFKPIIRLLDERRQKIEQGVTLGDQLLKKEKELEEKVSHELHQARIKADKIISDAEESAKNVVKKAEDNAVIKADSILNEAKDKMNSESLLMKQKLEADILTLISDTSSAILKKKLDSSEDKLLIERTLKEQQV